MAKAIFYHKHSSIYDDLPEERYHFPKSYLSRVEQTVDDHIIYYGPSQNSRCYSAVCKVKSIRSDPKNSTHYYADIEDYLSFDREVPYQENGGFELKLFGPDGKVNGGRAIQAVRIITDPEFVSIIEAGLSTTSPWPERTDIQDLHTPNTSGFGETQQEEFIGNTTHTERPIIQQLINKPYRDAKFRQRIREMYDRTCAFTGLRLINGGGRPEVEAAHIKPVSEGGPDSVRNGIALSGTVHWMFDRGMLSLSDSFDIMISRQLNHDIKSLLHENHKAKVPKLTEHRPHKEFLKWHRENCFKN